MDIELIPPDENDGRIWPVRPPLIDGELLSSWICRLAVANGLVPLALHEILSAAAGPTGKGWMDRSPSSELADYMARQADQPVERILRAAPLRPARLINRDDFVGRFVAASPKLVLRPNVTAKDAEEPERDAAYLAYCPQCLAEDEEPFMRMEWRTRFATGCERHGIRLQHCCPHCRGQIKPHLAKHLEGICFCAHCAGDLRQVAAMPLSQREKADITDVSLYLDAVLGGMPIEELAKKGEALIKRAISVINGRSNFWHLYFAPNEIGGGLEWMRRPSTAWRDGQAEELGRERLEARGPVWNSVVYASERLVSWDGQIPAEVGDGRLIGYANRYSDADVNMDKILDRQVGVLRIVGVPDSAIYVDDALVGSTEPRYGLRAMLKAARRGDTIVVMGLEFLGRSTMETMTTIERLQEAGFHLWLLDVQIHTGTPRGQALFDVVGLLEAAQRRRHVSWSKTVIMDGVAEGRFTLGKKPVPREKLLEGGRLLLSGVKAQAVAEAIGIAVPTVKKHRQTMLALARNDLDDLGPSDDR